MTENPTASDWATARGKKWHDHMRGMEAMLRPVDEPLIHWLHLDNPYRIADVGCGGGGTALALLNQAPTGSIVHGFDISQPLITSARDRIPPHEHTITFEIANITTAPAPQKPYDRLVSRFGIMFFDHPPTAFANLVHWLTPGGRFAFAVWGHPAENPWIMSVRQVVANLIDMPPPKPDVPGLFRYAEANRLLTLLDQAGFDELNVYDWRGKLPIGGEQSAAAAAQFAIASFSSFSEQLAQAGDNALKSLTAHFLQHQQNGAVWMDAAVHIVTGVRLDQGDDEHG